MRAGLSANISNTARDTKVLVSRLSDSETSPYMLPKYVVCIALTVVGEEPNIQPSTKMSKLTPDFSTPDQKPLRLQYRGRFSAYPYQFQVRWQKHGVPDFPSLVGRGSRTDPPKKFCPPFGETFWGATPNFFPLWSRAQGYLKIFARGCLNIYRLGRKVGFWLLGKNESETS